MGQVISMGVTGSKAKFTVDLPKHTLSFNTKVRLSRSYKRKVFILECFSFIYREKIFFSFFNCVYQS